MRVIRSSESFLPDAEGFGVGLGNFDGVHLGHAALIDRLTARCAALHIRPLLYTFSMHPTHVISKMRPAPLIMTEEQRLALFEKKGIAVTYLEEFTEDFAAMPPEQFVKEILIERLNTRLAVVGYDYTFGRRGQGTAEDLRLLGERCGFEVLILPAVEFRDCKISSTVLRELIAKGNVKDFIHYTGRLYSIPGKVVEGRRVGRQLGFPTANILPREGFAMPSAGVYMTYTKVEGDPTVYRSVTNVGANPTFGDTMPVTVETHILDYNRGLYGETIEVFFSEKLREEIRFPNAAALQARLQKDVEAARRMPPMPQGN